MCKHLFKIEHYSCAKKKIQNCPPFYLQEKKTYKAKNLLFVDSINRFVYKIARQHIIMVQSKKNRSVNGSQQKTIYFEYYK